ncbi:MAG: hypothetical protein NXI02_33340 [Rhodobacteraceae bacterium]|nr:hypothetical protein [Paracoccaceae bacterium]
MNWSDSTSMTSVDFSRRSMWIDLPQLHHDVFRRLSLPNHILILQ